MKGAMAELVESVMKAPTTNRTTMIGASHHFLRSFIARLLVICHSEE
jgi:hypothetical protein